MEQPKRKALLLLVFSLCTVFATAQTIPANYFGLTINHITMYANWGLTPWPTLTFGGARLWDVGVSWPSVEKTRGTYDWHNLDTWMNDAQQHNVELIYTLGLTPLWASSDKGANCYEGAGTCAPPSDITYWDEYVRAIATHSAGRIHYWELWNEPNESGFWTGTPAQLATLAQHAYSIIKSIDPTAVVLSPSATDEYGVNWASNFYAAGGYKYFDVVAFHGYYLPYNTPEHILNRVASYRALMNQYGIGSRQLIDSEYSWGYNSKYANADLQAAFLARSYLLHWSAGVSRTYWYSYDDEAWGTLWLSSTGLTKPGVAYREVARWMVGATLSNPCSISNGTWTCAFTRAGGYQALAVWNPSGSKSYNVPTQYRQYRDLNGVLSKVSGMSVQIGIKPILLETNTAF